MKKIISVILILVVMVGLVSCRSTDNSSSDVSTVQTVDSSLSQGSTEDETQIPPKNEETVYQSTIDTPTQVIFYKNGKYGKSTDKKLNLNVAKCVESWYKNYENDTLPLTKTAVSKEMIAKLIQNETVIEICFDYDQEINLLGKIKLEHTYRLLIPLTGTHAYYVFRGNSAYIYKNGLHAVRGSGLEKYFKGIKLDKDVKKWQSTVIAPAKVIFYKDGMQSVSTDKEFNHEIAKHIEKWFQYEDSIAVANLAATTDLINYNRRNEMAIELQFDGEIKFYGGVISEKSRTLFIPLTGDDDHLIFSNTLKYPDDWSGPIGTNGGAGLEKFFDKVQFTPLTEEEKRWQSTVATPSQIEFYENGKLIGELGEYMNDYAFNNKIALHIESWFYKKEKLDTITVSDLPIETAWANDTYIKVYFNSGPTFYGENIIPKEYNILVIPITGNYAYNIFVGDYNKTFSSTAYSIDGGGLEQFFEVIKNK